MRHKTKHHKVRSYFWGINNLTVTEKIVETLQEAMEYGRNCGALTIKVFDCDDILVHSENPKPRHDHDHHHHGHYA